MFEKFTAYLAEQHPEVSVFTDVVPAVEQHPDASNVSGQKDSFGVKYHHILGFEGGALIRLGVDVPVSHEDLHVPTLSLMGKLPKFVTDVQMSFFVVSDDERSKSMKLNEGRVYSAFAWSRLLPSDFEKMVELLMARRQQAIQRNEDLRKQAAALPQNQAAFRTPTLPSGERSMNIHARKRAARDQASKK